MIIESFTKRWEAIFSGTKNQAFSIDPMDTNLTRAQIAKLSEADQLAHGFAMDFARRGVNPRKHRKEINILSARNQDTTWLT